MLIKGFQLQKTLNTEISNLVYEARDNPLNSGFMLIVIGFLYGILHAVGPGHGKVLIATYLVTHPTKVKVSLMLTWIASFLQAIVAVALVTGLLSLLNASMRQVNQHDETLIETSFIALIIFGTYLMFNSLRSFYTDLHSGKEEKNVHNNHCCHGHIEAEEINRSQSFRDYVGLIVSIGIRPCSGAIMLLLFANMADTYWLGIVGAFTMAIGTAITTSSIALLVLYARKQVESLVGGGRLSSKTYERSELALKLAAGAMLAILGFIMLQTKTVITSPLL